MRKRKTKEEFIKEAQQIHNGDYEYNNFIYVDTKTKGEIYCKKHCQTFWQTPNHHLRGQGCPICRYEKSSNSKRHTNEWFIKKATEIWGNRYDLSKAAYKKYMENVIIICHNKDKFGNEHGEFQITPSNFFNKSKKQGCPKCARERTAMASKDTKEIFIEKAVNIHGNKYCYDEVEYVNSITPVKIFCPQHGYFTQRPSNHLQGQDCPLCMTSPIEKSMAKFLEKNNITFEQQKTFDWLKDKRLLRLDFYLNEYNVAIECQGRQHFKQTSYGDLSEIQRRDDIKYKLCKEHGVKIYYFSKKKFENAKYKLYTKKNVMLNDIKALC